MRSLARDAFGHLTALTQLYLGSNNLMTALPSQLLLVTFPSCDLDLGSNDLDRESELHQSILRYLYLGHNRLSQLPQGIFQELAALEHLSLNRNLLSSLFADVFTPLSSLVFIRPTFTATG